MIRGGGGKYFLELSPLEWRGIEGRIKRLFLLLHSKLRLKILLVDFVPGTKNIILKNYIEKHYIEQTKVVHAFVRLFAGICNRPMFGLVISVFRWLLEMNYLVKGYQKVNSGERSV